MFSNLIVITAYDVYLLRSKQKQKINTVKSYPECLVLIKHIPSGTLKLKINPQ
jgi:hypothetical protein